MKRQDHDISIRIQRDQDAYTVSETRFHVSASGSTRDEALASFWRVFFGYEEVLSEHFENILPEHKTTLSSGMLEQLQYIRAVRRYQHHYKKTTL